MEKSKTYEMLENHLKVIKTAQGAALKIVVEATQTKIGADGKPFQPVLGSEYWDAIGELKNLMFQEKKIVAELDALDPDLDFEVKDRYYFNEKGSLIVLPEV